MTHSDNHIPSELPDLDHAAVQTRLPEYVALASTGRDPESAFPAVAAHLERCADCYADFIELLELTALSQSDLSHIPVQAPDLAFLRPPVSMTRSPRGEVLVSFSRAILEALRQPKLVGAFRGQLLHKVSQTLSDAPAAEVVIEIHTEPEDATRCALTVRFCLLERSPFEQDGAQIQLQAGVLAQEKTSDPAGTVIFPGIPLDALPLLQLTIKPA